MKQELETAQNLANAVIEFGVDYGFQVLGAILIVLVGLFLARWTGGMVMRFCERRSFDVTLSKFFAGITRVTVLVFVLIVALNKFGVSIAPFVAALGAVAFGSSLALAVPLSNYGAGLAIILGRPFVVGNTITVNGRSGVVEEIKLAATHLSTEDGELLVIPNKEIVGQVLINSFENRVVELTVRIGYEDDPERAAAVIQEALKPIREVVGEPSPQIGILNFGETAIVIAVRYWVPTRRYFEVQFQANKAIWKALQGAGFATPYPRQELKILERQSV